MSLPRRPKIPELYSILSSGRPVPERAVYITLALILAVAAFLRFWNLDRTSIWYDESVSWLQSNGSFTHVLRATAADNYPPLHNLILWTQISLFGDSEVSLRLPSAILGLLTVAAIFGLGRKMWGPGAGLIAAFFLSINGFHIWYSRQARMYSLLMLVTVLFAWAAFSFLSRPGRWQAFLAGLSGLALLYSHIYGSFVFACINLYVILTLARSWRVNYRQLKIWIASQFVAGLLFLPWLFVLLRKTNSLSQDGFWIPDLTFRTAVDTGLESLTVHRTVFDFLAQHKLPWKFDALQPHLYANSTFLGFLFLAFSVFVILAASRPKSTSGDSKGLVETSRFPNSTILFLLSWLIGPYVIAIILSVLVFSIFLPRYLICVTPAFWLLLAGGIVNFPAQWAVRLWILVGLSLTFFLPNAYQYTFTHELEHQDWRKIAEVYNEHAEPGDKVVFQVRSICSSPFSYYADFLEPVPSPVGKDWLSAIEPQENRLWVVGCYKHDDFKDQAVQILDDKSMRLLGSWNAYYAINLLLFDAAENGPQ